MLIKPTIAVVTHFPSPYQVELFNKVESQRPGCLRVFYLHSHASDRQWSPIKASHEHKFLDPKVGGMSTDENATAEADLVVFNYYNDPRVARLIRLRAASGQPWVFWGERPGYRFPWLGRLARLHRLAALRSSHQPVWGIGQWAVDAYRREFGTGRHYLNLPYYSDLERFQTLRPSFRSEDFTFLFSGSLSHRKGVDLLARAFARLAAENPRVRLILMGAGRMERNLRATLGTCGRVQWTGFKDWGQLPSVYESAHVLCVPSRYDGWGMVVPEGLATGLPVIATVRTGAAHDFLASGQNGLLIEGNDWLALYRAMKEMAQLDEARWSEWSGRARQSVAAHSLANGAARFLAAAEHASFNAGSDA